MPDDRAEDSRVSPRIASLIEHHRRLSHRRLLRRAMRIWRRAELRYQLARFEAPGERVH
jgi:hypothetical protein